MTYVRGRRCAGGEGGFTLIETTVVVAILAIVAGTAFTALAQRPATTRMTALTLGSFIERARALAATTGDTLDGSGGATVGVVPDGTAAVATLYRYRPVRAALHVPVPAADPPLRLALPIALGARAALPFAIFISPSGHASAQAGFAIGSSAPLVTEPRCNAATGLRIIVGDAAHAVTYRVNCNMAQLNLDDDTADGPASDRQPP